MGGDGRAAGPAAPHGSGNDTGVINLVPMAYDVQTPVFEGPFDLLLHLILREQVDLYEICLTKIVDAYLAELEQMETARPRRGHRVPPHRGHAHRAEDPAPAARRRRHRPRRGAGPLGGARPAPRPPARVQDVQGRRRRAPRAVRRAGRSFPRVAGLDERFIDLTPDLLDRRHARRPAGRLPAGRRAQAGAVDRPRPRGTDPRVSVTDAVAELLDELPRVGHITFRALTASLVDRLEVVVRFLAVLELFKQGLVDLDQPRTFGDIEIVWLGRDRSELDRSCRRSTPTTADGAST